MTVPCHRGSNPSEQPEQGAETDCHFAEGDQQADQHRIVRRQPEKRSDRARRDRCVQLCLDGTRVSSVEEVAVRQFLQASVREGHAEERPEKDLRTSGRVPQPCQQTRHRRVSRPGARRFVTGARLESPHLRERSPQRTRSNRRKRHGLPRRAWHRCARSCEGGSPAGRVTIGRRPRPLESR